MVLPGCRRRNATKVAIRNFKSHFLSVLTGTAESFPVHLWDRLERYTDSFSIRTLIWTIRLQQNVISPNGPQSKNPQKNGQTRYVVVPFCGRMVFSNVTQTLQSPQLLCQNNRGGKTHRHHPIQVQDYNQPHNQPIGQDNASIGKLQDDIKGHDE